MQHASMHANAGMVHLSPVANRMSGPTWCLHPLLGVNLHSNVTCIRTSSCCRPLQNPAITLTTQRKHVMRSVLLRCFVTLFFEFEFDPSIHVVTATSSQVLLQRAPLCVYEYPGAKVRNMTNTLAASLRQSVINETQLQSDSRFQVLRSPDAAGQGPPSHSALQTVLYLLAVRH